MRLSKHRPSGRLAFNLTPMIDIVFLLIIFFMTVAQITRTMDTPLPLPRVSEGPQESRTAAVTINVTLEGQLIVDGQPVSSTELLTRLRRRLSQVDQDPDRIPLQLRVDRRCPSRHVSQLMQDLADLGFQHVRSAVTDL